MIEIKGEHEDLIFKKREFIREISKIQDEYFETLFQAMKKEGFSKKLETHLFDYIFNDNSDDLFEEYLHKNNVF